MNIFIKKLKLIERLQEEVDNYVWDVFHKYIDINQINFNSPDDWNMEGDRVYFHGSDGCMGCYDNMSVGVPIKYFENPDYEFGLLKKELEHQKLKDERLEKCRKKQKEISELKRLKKKYEQ
jgi:hypothetical protein